MIFSSLQETCPLTVSITTTVFFNRYQDYHSRLSPVQCYTPLSRKLDTRGKMAITAHLSLPQTWVSVFKYGDASRSVNVPMVPVSLVTECVKSKSFAMNDLI